MYSDILYLLKGERRHCALIVCVDWLSFLSGQTRRCQSFTFSAIFRRLVFNKFYPLRHQTLGFQVFGPSIALCYRCDRQLSIYNIFLSRLPRTRILAYHVSVKLNGRAPQLVPLAPAVITDIPLSVHCLPMVDTHASVILLLIEAEYMHFFVEIKNELGGLHWTLQGGGYWARLPVTPFLRNVTS